MQGVEDRQSTSSVFENIKEENGKGRASTVKMSLRSLFGGCTENQFHEVVDEYLTSQVHFDTGERVHRVFMKSSKNDLFDLPYHKRALIRDDDQTVYRKSVETLMDSLRRRRRKKYEMTETSRVVVKQYPEVRGLRFDPETRKYLNRDVMSAVSIAKLRVMEMLGYGRPMAFSRNNCYKAALGACC
jgi:hypothetical protein